MSGMQMASSRPSFVQRLFALILMIMGLALGVGGVQLLMLGGSLYYVLAGAALLASGVLLWRGRKVGRTLYFLFLLATVAWALWEVGFDGWALLPRVGLFIALGLWLLLPWGHRGLASIVLVGASLLMLPGQSSAQMSDGEWRHYGNDLGGSRYSALDQINTDNVAQLEQVWVHRADQGDAPTPGLQVTPIMVGDTVYLCASKHHIIALDPETGDEKWRFDPKSTYPVHTCRGVAYFEVPGAPHTDLCAQRILMASSDSRLWAVDAATGQPCLGFGKDGAVDLTVGMGEVKPGYFRVSSAPTIVRGRIMISGWVSDNQYVGEPSGVIRAFSAVSGDLVWAWDMDHPDRKGLPPEGESYSPGTPNSWAPMSGDEELGLVYLPMGNATPDYWGGHRSDASEVYASSVTALDVETGEPRWVFQTVHHDVWDYDVASQPTLIELVIEGEKVPALIQPTKQGQVFLLDRRTGKPLAEVEEIPVPQGAAEGDWLSPTQPFSVGMPAFETYPLTEHDMWGITPFDQLWCRIKFREARYDGMFTPPNTHPTLTYPGYLGGQDWGSISIDPVNKLMITNWNRFPNHTWLIPRDEADKMGVKAAEEGISHVYDPSAQEGTPFAVFTQPFMSPLRVPCTRPPYGLVSVVDLNSREVVWTKPVGTARDSGPLDIPSQLPFTIGAPMIGGTLTTAGGVIFMGATMERAIRALDIKTGKELWKARLPAAAHATPMTYLSPTSGRQIVVIAAGGHPVFGGKLGDYIIAYALPDKD